MSDYCGLEDAWQLRVWEQVPPPEVPAAVLSGVRRLVSRFIGGDLSRWIHDTFPQSACCVAIVGSTLMAINLVSSGGLGRAQSLERVNFNQAVIAALERRARYMTYYRRDLNDVDMATL